MNSFFGITDEEHNFGSNYIEKITDEYKQRENDKYQNVEKMRGKKLEIPNGKMSILRISHLTPTMCICSQRRNKTQPLTLWATPGTFYWPQICQLLLQ